jgi:ring-1,2-phenylacetyl-CoA epoxidase subunit PaaE
VQVRRSYSICAEPKPGEIRIAIKRDLGGSFSTWANQSLRRRDVLQVMSPQGAFISQLNMTELNHPNEIQAETARTATANFVAIAAGSGITPIIAIAKTALEASASTRFDLVYANKAAMDVKFLQERADLKDRYLARFAVHHVLSPSSASHP